MKNFVQPGDSLSLVAPYDVASGAGFQVGGFFAVAKYAVTAGTPVDAKRTGVIDLAKNSGEAWIQGQLLYWDNANKRLTTTAAGNKLVGAAVQNQASADVVGRACITGQIS